MKMSAPAGTLALLLALVFCTSAAQSAPYHPFYPHTYRIKTKHAFVSALIHAHRVDQEALLRLYNEEEASIAPHMSSFEDLIRFIESDEVTVQPCDWNSRNPEVYIFSVDASGTQFRREHRACKPEELVLSYRGQTLFSLYCGNLVHDPRQPVVRTPLPPQRCFCENPLIRTSTYNLDTGAWQVGWSAEDVACR